MAVGENPRKWTYTYEAQSHLPILKLFLFNPQINPNSLFKDLKIDLHFEKSLLKLTWNHTNSLNQASILVPLPRVLVDLDSSPDFRVLDDHIEVKIPLLLPVDHPIVSSFIAELNFENEDSYLQPLVMDSDLKRLTTKGDVDFYCRNCGFTLTKTSIRCFGDLPSINWTDVADNWFGGCCCSFGGISEKLVANYVKSYRCMEGSCLLTTASVILCKNDISGFKPPENDRVTKLSDNCPIDSASHSGSDVVQVNGSAERTKVNDPEKEDLLNHQAHNSFANGAHVKPDIDSGHDLSWTQSRTDVLSDTSSKHHCSQDVSKSSLKDQAISGQASLQVDQKLFLNCYLGDAFLFRSSGLSKDIEWIDFACPQCSSILGAFPSADGSEPLDGGIRLFKCYITISPPSDSYIDLFSKYTLERMFTCQLLESAKDELSFRTMVKDLKSKSPMLNMVLLNPNSWCCTGYCFEGIGEQFCKINLRPAAKVLFSHCNEDKLERRVAQEWEMKNQADEIFMLPDVVSELIKSLKSSKDMFPPSFSTSQAFILSSLPR